MSTNSVNYQNDEEKAVIESALAQHRAKKSKIQEHLDEQERLDAIAGAAMRKEPRYLNPEERSALESRIRTVLTELNQGQ